MSEVEPEITNTIEADAPGNELPPIEEEEAPKAEPTIEPTQEIKPVEPLKNNSKTQARNEKKITCPKCAKTLTLKSYRYSHERNCQGPLETKPIKPKPKAVPIAKPQRIDHEVAYNEENQQPQPQQNNIIANTPPPRRSQQQPPPNPLHNIAQHYQLLQNEYMRQKQEKYNALNRNIFWFKRKEKIKYNYYITYYIIIMFSTLPLDGSNRIVASELVLINSTEPSTLSSVYATKQELADTAGSLGGGYTIEEVDVLILAQKNKIDANILDITELNATSTTMFNEQVNQNATITSNFNNITAHGLTITSILPTISANTIKLDSIFNNISSNTHLVSNLNASITSHISLIDTNINNITGHGNTITTILTDIANLQAGGGASWTTTEKTTIQADVSTLYANDTNLFNTNTAYSNTFASIISDNNIQDLLITQNSNTINSLISADLQKLDKTITTAQTMNSPLIISLTDNTNPIFRIQDAVSNQRLEFKRGCQLDSYQGLTGATPYRLWLGWNTGDVIIGRPNNASRIAINGNVHTSYNFAQAHGTSYFEGAVYMKGNLFTNNDFSTDIKTKIDNLDNALTPYLETHTPAATEGFYIHHPNFVACSIGDITNSSNQYFMCDGAVSKTIFNKPVDVLGDVYTNGDLTMVSGKKVEVNQVQSVSGNTLLLQNSPSGNVQFGNTSKLIIDNAENLCRYK